MPKLGCVSASACGVLLVDGKKPENKPFGVGAVTYARQLAAERIGVEPEDQYTSYAMEQGLEQEWMVLETYEERNFIELHGKQGWIEHPEFKYFGGTPDGLVGTVGGVDSKCRNITKHMENILDQADLKNDVDQMQAYMMITGAKWWDIASYNGNFPPPLNLHVMRMLPDMAWQSKMKERLPLFMELVLNIEKQLRAIMEAK